MKHARILGLIPHAGAMCLIDEVIRWDDAGIDCQSRISSPAHHPLAGAGGLATVSLIEYGAQAAAVHGVLRARAGGESPMTGGVLASVRDINLEEAVLPEREIVLDIRARRQMGDGVGAIYDVEIDADRVILVCGRLTVMAGHTGRGG